MKMQANYQPVMIKFLLSRTNYTASKTEIAKELESANSFSQKNYEEVPVFGVLTNHNIVTEINGLFTLNVEDLDETQIEKVNNALDVAISTWFSRTVSTATEPSIPSVAELRAFFEPSKRPV